MRSLGSTETRSAWISTEPPKRCPSAADSRVRREPGSVKGSEKNNPARIATAAIIHLVRPRGARIRGIIVRIP